jgi:hypothetical protein
MCLKERNEIEAPPWGELKDRAVKDEGMRKEGM